MKKKSVIDIWMRIKDLLGVGNLDPSKKDGSYQDSLIQVTKAGTVLTSLFFIGFTLVYWFGNYPILTVWVNLAATLCSMTGYILITRFKRHRLTAHLVTFAIYLSSAGVMTISGGIHSSSVIWQIFVPVAAFIMAGLWAGLRWGMVCLVTVVAFYSIETLGFTHFTGFETTITDRLIDLSGAIFAVSIAIWYSDRLKTRSLTQLEEAKAQLKYLATVDPLTNTFNRRYFLELAERKVKRPHTKNGYASFLFFDIDLFKNINDVYGHMIGDQILHGTSQRCLKHLRPDDVLGRYGGEMFVILLPDTTLEDAKNIAERLRLLISENPIQTEIGAIHTTISIGVANTENAHATTIEQLISNADRAMYRAKQNGRNRVIVWEDHELQTT